MKKSLRVLVLVLIGVFTLSFVLAGCGDKTESGNAAAPGETQAVSATEGATEPTEAPAINAADLEPYELSWFYVGPNQQPDTDVVEEEIGKYLKDKINATVQLNLLDWGTYNDKISAMIAAGERFDICFTASWMNDYVRNSQDGAFMVLDDYFKKELHKTYEILGDDFLSGSRIDGHNYGIPCNKEKARDYGFIYNKTLADKYGFDMSTIKSFKDIEPMLKVIKEKEPHVIPLHFEQQGPVNFIPWNFENLMKNNGYATAIKDGKVINAFESPEFAEAFALSRDFYNKGYYRPDVLTAQDGPTVMKTGNWFAFSMNLKPDYDLEYQARYSDVNWVCAQQDVTEIRITNSDTMGSMQAISRTSKDPQRAAMFLELVNTDAYLSNLINYGIEGKHYTKVSDNVIRAVKDNQYGPNMQWMFGNQMLTFLNETESPEKWQKYADFNKNAIPNEELGFIFNIEPVQTEMSAVANIVNEYFLALTCGAVDPAVKLPEMNAKLKAAGVEKIITEEQKQYDAWEASK